MCVARFADCLRAVQELTGGMRADGGSIVSVHGDVSVTRSGDEDAELRALLDLPTVRPPT